MKNSKGAKILEHGFSLGLRRFPFFYFPPSAEAFVDFLNLKDKFCFLSKIGTSTQWVNK